MLQRSFARLMIQLICSVALVSQAAAADRFLDQVEQKLFDSSTKRRFGIEIELSGIPTRKIAEVLSKALGGSVEDEPGKMKVLGKDGQIYMKEFLRLKLRHTSIGRVLVKREDNSVNIAEVEGNYGKTELTEIVTEPIYFADVLELQKALVKLVEAGATGTDEKTAVSIQVNIEMGNGNRETIHTNEVLDILRTYLGSENYAEIQETWKVPDVRKPYLGKYMPGFMAKLANPNYKPTWDDLYADFMYRQGLELVGYQNPYSLSREEASKLLQAEVEKRGFDFLLPIMKWNHVKLASLLMFMKRDEWLSKTLTESGWIRPLEILEFRDPNNDFDVTRVVKRVTALVEGAEIAGPLTSAKLNSETVNKVKSVRAEKACRMIFETPLLKRL